MEKWERSYLFALLFAIASNTTEGAISHGYMAFSIVWGALAMLWFLKSKE